MASMRPRLLHLGYAEGEVVNLVLILRASMRPRLLHLGYGPGYGAGYGAGYASMRPRLLHLGYGSSMCATPSNACALQ